MHYNRVNLQVNPNNQIVLTYGNYRDTSECYKSRELGYKLDNHGKEKLKQMVDRMEDRRKTKYDWRGAPIVKRSIKVPPSLAIIKKLQDGKRKPLGYRPKSFTQAAGQKLRECGAAIDQVCGKPENCYTVTLTLPGDTERSFKTLADYSGFAINYLFQPVRDTYGDEVYWFFVWEYQKRGALHIHLCVYHPDAAITKTLANLLCDRWYVVLEHIEERSGVDMFIRRDGKTYTDKSKYHRYIQPVKRSLGAYFSKYAGKTESKNNWYCQKYPVSRFWGCSKILKDLIKSLSFDFTMKNPDSEIIEAIVEGIMAKLCRADITIKSEYDFDIGKKYGDYDRICFASGTRITAYCKPESYRAILGILSTTSSAF